MNHSTGSADVTVNSRMANTTTSKPMVLHVRVVTNLGGGPEKTILNSPRFLDALGYNAICAYMHPPEDPSLLTLRARAAQMGATLASVPDGGPLDLRVLWQLVQLCRQYKVAIWHAHDYKSNALGLLIRWVWPMKLVTTVHGWVQQTSRTPLYYGIDKFCLRFYETVLCVSDDLYRECRRIGVPQSRCHLIHNAIDLKQFCRSEATVTGPGPRPRPKAIRLGAMGRLSAEKGFDLLIDAVAQLLHAGHDLSLWIAGEGDNRGQLERQIKALDCGDRIVLLGYVDDPQAFFAGLDMFVLSSVREGLPNVILEAMALQVPIISTRVAGVSAVIQDGHNGLLVNSGSIDNLAAAILRLSQDAELRTRFAEAGRQTVEQAFCFEKRMRDIVALYDRLLTDHQTAKTG